MVTHERHEKEKRYARSRVRAWKYEWIPNGYTNKKIRSYRVFVSLFLLLDSSVITVISEIPTSAPKS